MTWFERLVGFAEGPPDAVRDRLQVEGPQLVSTVNGRSMTWGSFELASLADLRDRVLDAFPDGASLESPLRVREVVADVQALHTDPAHAGALFQVASQFNTLEMIGPDVTPERGVGIYEYDGTQGPACAIAAGAGTIWRNYFVPVGEQLGQTADIQVDGLADLSAALGNDGDRLWTMRNGYALATADGLREIRARLEAADEDERDRLRGLLRVGIQWDTEVTLHEAGHLVSQVYASALPVAYSHHSSSHWAPFATLVLEAAYEATMWAAVLNRLQTGNDRVFLTSLGGGAFGNDRAWITRAIERALDQTRGCGLDVALVSYGSPNRHIRHLLTGAE